MASIASGIRNTGKDIHSGTVKKYPVNGFKWM